MDLQDKNNMNYIKFTECKIPVYICLNHRAVLLCWNDALKNRFINKGALLFHIDYHADFCLTNFELLDKQLNINNEKELTEFVKTELHQDNSEFIVLAMNNGNISDTISIHKEDGSIPFEKIEGEYKTTDHYIFKAKDRTTHTFYLGGSSLSGLIGSHSLLTDTCIHQDTKNLFENKTEIEKNMILDIDFDFFTYGEDKRFARNERDLEKTFTSEEFNLLINRANILTIALEPRCCGGKEECISILNIFDKFVFKNLGINNAINKIIKTLLNSY